MILKFEFDEFDLRNLFKEYNRDYYNESALRAWLNFAEETDFDEEFNVIGFCCDWNQYSISDETLLDDYGYLLEREEDEEVQDYYRRLCEELNDYTIVLECDDDDTLLIGAF